MGSSLGSSSLQSINNDLYLSTAIPGELSKFGNMFLGEKSSAGSESSVGSFYDEDEKEG